MKALAPFALILGLSPAANVLADDFDPAAFVASNCSNCHGDEVYTRPDRRVQNLDALHAQVRRCDANLGTRLFDDDLNALVQYLNASHYHFQN